jgi:hypothetical protein
MAKDKPQKTVKVLALTPKDGGYSILEYEISESTLNSNGILKSASEPDVFAIMLMHLTKKAREILNI